MPVRNRQKSLRATERANRKTRMESRENHAINFFAGKSWDYLNGDEQCRVLELVEQHKLGFRGVGPKRMIYNPKEHNPLDRGA